VAELNKSWFPGALRGEGDDHGGFLFTREQAEKFFSYWARAAQNVVDVRNVKKSSLTGLWSKIKGADDAYAKLNGRSINMVFRTLDSEPTLQIKESDDYKLRADVLLLALDVMADAVRRAKVNEPLGYAKEPEDALGGMLGGNNMLRGMLKSSIEMDRQNATLLEAYGGEWPEKTRTRAGQHHLDHLREIALGRCDLDASLDSLMRPQAD
jgi:hypothetical protein